MAAPLQAAAPGRAAPPRGPLWHAIQLKAAQVAAEPAGPSSRDELPAGLKAGVERLSGIAMDDVRVHRNSSEPAKVGALAFARGSDIHLGPGQERHLPHEAWHVVQQKQGRVKPLLQMKGAQVNDDPALEREADAMGGAAAGLAAPASPPDGESRRPLPRAGGGKSEILQRKIMFKDKKVWAADSKLPAAMYGTHIEQVAASPDTYLAQNADDMTKRATRKPAPLLTPHRHVIGEEHHKSKFDKAVSDWGWGADKMSEGFQESRLVPDKHAIAERDRKSGPSYGVKPLENFHAYMLTGFAVLKIELIDLGEHYHYGGEYAGSVDKGVEVADAKRLFGERETKADEARAKAAHEWKTGIVPHLDSYQAAWASAKNKELAVLDFMKDHWKTILATFPKLIERPYSFATNWKNTAANLVGTTKALEAFITNIVDSWTTALILLTEEEIKMLAQPPAIGKAEMDTSLRQALAVKSAYKRLSPVREVLMERSINALGKPGIVAVGFAHVEPLRGKIVDGKLFDDYEAFVADTNKLPPEPVVQPPSLNSAAAPQPQSTQAPPNATQPPSTVTQAPSNVNDAPSTASVKPGPPQTGTTNG